MRLILLKFIVIVYHVFFFFLNSNILEDQSLFLSTLSPDRYLNIIPDEKLTRDGIILVYIWNT